MSRSTTTVLAVLAVATSAALMGISPSAAAPSATAVAHADRRVCATPAPGFAACDAHVVTDARTARPLATTTYTNGYRPAQLTSAYGPFGSGAPLVAVIDAYAHPSAAADLKVYRDTFGLGTASLTQVNQSGGSITTVSGNTGWGQEEMLDLEMVSAICPSCSILYVGANSASFSDLSAAVTRAAKLGAKVISNSYGANEFSTESSITTWNIPGVAVTVSSGDSGYGVQFPAASAGVIAVGGTSLTLDSSGQRLNETAWSGAGSGCSAYISKPSWQKDPACSRRTVADVSAVADPNTGVAVYDSYGSTGGANWYVFGGTSVAAPIIGAIYARDGIPTSGYATASLYATPSGLFDVVSGSNGRCTRGKNTSGAYLCTAVAGYDGPTGLGAPNGLPSPF